MRNNAAQLAVAAAAELWLIGLSMLFGQASSSCDHMTNLNFTMTYELFNAASLLRGVEYVPSGSTDNQRLAGCSIAT
jgi:hypothetical protein